MNPFKSNLDTKTKFSCGHIKYLNSYIKCNPKTLGGKSNSDVFL